MALTFEATVGSASATSYLTTAEADDYFSARYGAEAWTSLATAADKEKALMAATARLELEEYVGGPTFVDQRLKWPRFPVEDDAGRLIDNETIPRHVKEACAELALYLVQQNAAGTDPNAATGLEPFSALSLGPISLTLRDAPPSAGAMPTIVLRALGRYRVGGGGFTTFERTS